MLSRAFNNLGVRLGSASLRFAGTLTRRTCKQGNPLRPISLNPAHTTAEAIAPHPDHFPAKATAHVLPRRPGASRSTKAT